MTRPRALRWLTLTIVSLMCLSAAALGQVPSSEAPPAAQEQPVQGQPTQEVPDNPPPVAAEDTAEPAPLEPAETDPAAGEPVGMEEAAPLPAAHDLSPWGMFMAADIVVKSVMVGLALASVLTWTVLVAKAIELGAAKRRVARALGAIGSARSLAEAAEHSRPAYGPVHGFVRAAVAEHDLWFAGMDKGGLRDRIASRLERLVASSSRRMTKGTGILATIGSTAPFVGLFGTVWGIMNSFIGISEAQTTNLAVVAPGIAEALLATAMGLVAAIPAVVIYNAFARGIAGYKALLMDAAAELQRLASRDVDRAMVSLRKAAE